MHAIQTIATVLALAGSALGHIRLTGFNGQTNCVRLPPNNSPIENPSSTDMICNRNGATPASGICTVAAGSSAYVTWDTGAHPGPELVYMAKVSDPKTTAIQGLRWFKISHSGLLSGGKWASDVVNSNGGKYSFNIPSSIAAGSYLLRGETIGLHVAQNVNGAQYYMSCVQLQVTGGGGQNPGGVSIPGVYQSNSPGILINIYYPPLTSYTIPGPAPI